MQTELNVIVIDPATNTGYQKINLSCNVCKKLSVDSAKIRYPEFFSVADKNGKDALYKYYLFFKDLFMKERPIMVAREEYFFSYNARKGSLLNVEFRTAIDLACCELQIPIYIIKISEWKKFIHMNNSCRVPKDYMKKKQNRNKEYVRESLLKKYNISLPEKILNEKSGKMIKCPYDLYDVTAMSIFFCIKILKTKNYELFSVNV